MPETPVLSRAAARRQRREASQLERRAMRAALSYYARNASNDGPDTYLLRDIARSLENDLQWADTVTIA